MIRELRFRKLSDDDIRDLCKFEIEGTKADIKDENFGGNICKVCARCQSDKCKGHNAYITLPYKIFNPFYETLIYNMLKDICLRCKKEVSKCRCANPNTVTGDKMKISDDGTEIKDSKGELLIDAGTFASALGKKADSLVTSVILIPYLDIDENASAALKDNYTNLLKRFSDLTESERQLSLLKTKTKAKTVNARKSRVEMYNAIKAVLFTTSNVRGYGMITKDQKFSNNISILSGKKGLIRSKLLGGNIYGFGRAVIVPSPMNPNIIMVPKEIAQSIKIKITIDRYNIKFYEEYLDIPLSEGSVVTSPLLDGMVVIANRQPTLSEGSLVAFDVIVWDSPCIGIHQSLMATFAGDFDGDEMNLWVPLTSDTINEVRSRLTLQARQFNRVTRLTPTLKPQQDPVLAMYMISIDDEPLSPQEVDILLNEVFIRSINIDEFYETCIQVLELKVPEDIPKMRVCKAALSHRLARNVLIAYPFPKGYYNGQPLTSSEIMKLLAKYIKSEPEADASMIVDRIYNLASTWFRIRTSSFGVEDFVKPLEIREREKKIRDECLAVKREDFIRIEHYYAYLERKLQKYSKEATDFIKSRPNRLHLLHQSESRGKPGNIAQMNVASGFEPLSQDTPTSFFPFDVSDVPLFSFHSLSEGLSIVEYGWSSMKTKDDIAIKAQKTPYSGEALRDASKSSSNMVLDYSGNLRSSHYILIEDFIGVDFKDLEERCKKH